MPANEMQSQVDDWIRQYKDGYWKPHEMLARLIEEMGELSGEINRLYGPKKSEDEENTERLSEEMGDIIFTLCCLANSLDIDLEDAFSRAMDKCYLKDKARFSKE
jgi:NTP pyrophosphatase (non-canonical NTP hydrolase)